MCSSESLLLSLEGIKSGVCDVESRTSEFSESLLAAFLNGTGVDQEVENEMAQLMEAVGQLKEIIQTIETKIRQNIDGGDNVQNFIKLEADYCFHDEALESPVPDVKQSIELIESESSDVSGIIVSVRSLKTESKELKNPCRNDGDQEESVDDPGRSCKRSKGCKAGFVKSARKDGINLRKFKPKSARIFINKTGEKEQQSYPSYISNDIKLKQQIKISLTRLPENEPLSSVPRNLAGEIPIKRAAAVKALSNFHKRKSSDSYYSSSGAETEGCISNNDIDFDADEEMLDVTGNNSPCISQNRSSKLEKDTTVGNSVKSPCPKCGVMLVPGRMKIHVKLHDDPTVFNFVCNICTIRFVSEGHFKTHQLSHESAFSCTHCDKKFWTDAGLKEHVQENHSTDDTVKLRAVIQNCRWCLKEISFKKKGLAFHEARCLRILGNSKDPVEGPWKCFNDECSQRSPFSNFLEFKIHMKSGVHPSPSDHDSLVQETSERTEVDKEMFSCPKCNELHGSKSFFNHIKFCLCGGHQGATVKCPLCQVEFALHKYLVEHLKMHQRKDRSPNGSLFHCSKCDKRFVHEKTYEKHEAVTHSSDRPFSCNKCPFTCKLKTLLKNHLRSIHPSQENPPRQRVICELCGHTFAEKKNLNGHMRQVHLGIRPYSCTLCDKSFKVRSHLDYHLKTHDNPNCQKRSLNKPRRRPVYRTGPPIVNR